MISAPFLPFFFKKTKMKTFFFLVDDDGDDDLNGNKYESGILSFIRIR